MKIKRNEFVAELLIRYQIHLPLYLTCPNTFAIQSFSFFTFRVYYSTENLKNMEHKAYMVIVTVRGVRLGNGLEAHVDHVFQ